MERQIMLYPFMERQIMLLFSVEPEDNDTEHRRLTLSTEDCASTSMGSGVSISIF